MSKRHKKKSNKSQILQARHVYNQTTGTSTTMTASSADQATTSSPVSIASNGSVAAAADSNVGDKFHLHHVYTDLRFFFLTTILLVVILVVIYFWDQSRGIILTEGQQLYKLLNIK
jgi:hypothetical protein